MSSRLDARKASIPSAVVGGRTPAFPLYCPEETGEAYMTLPYFESRLARSAGRRLQAVAPGDARQ